MASLMATMETVTMRQNTRATLDAQGLALQFDAVISETHGLRLTVTENPVESGVNIADHCYVEGATLALVGSIADVKMPNAAGGYESPSGRSNYGYQRLCDIERRLASNELQPFEIITSVKTYSDMVMTEISMARDRTTPFLGRFTMSFREIVIVNLQEVTGVPEVGRPRRSATPTKNSGQQQAPAPSDQQEQAVTQQVSKAEHIKDAIFGFLNR
jgi:hypothetical protein